MIAVTLQSAWEALPASAHGMLPKNETMFRCLLIGGGGCGKTRIINRVLRPLFSAFFGANAVQTQAPSNKAARQIHGKTMHSANKLRVDSSLRTVHLRLTATTRKSLELSTVPLGAMILDEFSQCIGQMLHADSLRKTYGRYRVLTTWSCTVMLNHKRPGEGCLLSSLQACRVFFSCHAQFTGIHVLTTFLHFVIVTRCLHVETFSFVPKTLSDISMGCRVAGTCF